MQPSGASILQSGQFYCLVSMSPDKTRVVHHCSGSKISLHAFTLLYGTAVWLLQVSMQVSRKIFVQIMEKLSKEKRRRIWNQIRNRELAWRFKSLVMVPGPSGHRHFTSSFLHLWT